MIQIHSNFNALLLFSIFVAPILAEFPNLSEEDVDEIKKTLEPFIIDRSIATAVRLSFHDCVGPEGCNGCININNPDNAGLEDFIVEMEIIYQENEYFYLLSRADFWALTGIYAVEKGIENSSSDDCSGDYCLMAHYSLVFQWGRKDCSTSPYTSENVGLPSALLDNFGVLDYFKKEFGFNETETVALMGAHTLGRANTSNSGFEGVWIEDEADTFDNDYYMVLVDPSNNWVHSDNTPNKNTSHWQWDAEGVAFMIDADVALYKDIQIDSDGHSSCEYTACEDAPTAEIVERYAFDNSLWINDFANVYTKMIGHGYTNLNDLS